MTFTRFFLIALLCAACQNHQTPSLSQKAQDALPPNTIHIEQERLANLELGLYQVERKPLRYDIKVPADVFASPNGESFVGSNIAGRIQKLLVNENDFVREGAPLAILESAAIASLIAEFHESRAAYELADADYKRKQKIATENILSEKILLESHAALRIAEARLFGAQSKCFGAGFTKADLEKIKANPDSAVTRVLIRSNLSGVVAKRLVTLGEYVEASKPLFQLVRLDEVMLIGSVFEPEFGKVRVGQPVEVSFGAFHSETFVGKIHSIGAIVNETTHALPVRVLLANPHYKLKPSMHTEMRITIESEQPELIVPSSAIGIDGNKRMAFVQKNDTTFEARYVKLAEEIGGFCVINKGLKEGEVIAAKNIFFLKSQWKASELAED